MRTQLLALPAVEKFQSERPAPPVTAHRQSEAVKTQIDEPLKCLARALGREAARRHMARGRSIIELALALALAALAFSAAVLVRGWL